MKCPCCGLAQPQAYDTTGVKAQVCAHCTHHQGGQDAKRLLRAESHERMLREQLDACRASEAQAQAKAAEARKATASALHSRAYLAARLVEAADRNGNHRCAVQAIARETQVAKWARQVDEDGT